MGQWGQVLHDPDPAEAIIDRILEGGGIIEFGGRSYRTPHPGRTPKGKDHQNGSTSDSHSGP